MCSNMPNVYKGSGMILSIKYGFQTKEPDPNVVTFHFWPCDQLWVDQYAKYIRDGIQFLWNHTASCYDTPRSAINAGSFAVWYLDERWQRYHMKQYGFQCHFYCIEYSNMVVRSDKIKNNPLEWVAFYAKLYSIGCKINRFSNVRAWKHACQGDWLYCQSKIHLYRNWYCFSCLSLHCIQYDAICEEVCCLRASCHRFRQHHIIPFWLAISVAGNTETNFNRRWLHVNYADIIQSVANIEIIFSLHFIVFVPDKLICQVFLPCHKIQVYVPLQIFFVKSACVNKK